MLLTKTEGILTVKDANGNPLAVVYKDMESKDRKYCIFYKLEEMNEESIADLLSNARV